MGFSVGLSEGFGVGHSVGLSVGFSIDEVNIATGCSPCDVEGLLPLLFLLRMAVWGYGD